MHYPGARSSEHVLPERAWPRLEPSRLGQRLSIASVYGSSSENLSKLFPALLTLDLEKMQKLEETISESSPKKNHQDSRVGCLGL